MMIKTLEKNLIVHGSENSLDKDVFVICDKKMQAVFPDVFDFIKNSKKNELQKICKNIDSIFDVNSNLIILDEQNYCVKWSFKGVLDETNNALYNTFSLHEQFIEECPVKILLPRNQGLKFLRTIRGILSYFSRTQYREDVKSALHCSDVLYKISTLQSINLETISDFSKNHPTEVFKFIAFQLAQTSSLLFYQKEIFTKNQAVEQFPHLEQYISRKPLEIKTLNDEIKKFCKEAIPYIEIQEDNVIFSFNNLKEKINVKEEKILEENPLTLKVHHQKSFKK